VEAGLAVPRFGPELEARLRALLPDGAACSNPVDTTATVDSDALRACIDTVVAAATWTPSCSPWSPRHSVIPWRAYSKARPSGSARSW
jgi:hypothetical protein